MGKKINIIEILLYSIALAIINLPMLIINICDISYESYINFNPYFISLIAPFYLLSINIFLSKKNQEEYPIIRAIPSIIILLLGNVLDVLINNIFGTGTDSIGNLLLNYRAIFGILVVIIGLYIYQTILLFIRKGR